MSGLLASEEVNIAAVAKYLGILADRSATKSASSPPHSLAAFPSLRLDAHAGPTSRPAAFFDRAIRLVLLTTLILAGAPSCRSAAPGVGVMTVTERHPNGLSVTLPRTLDVAGLVGPQPVSLEPTPNGFAVAVAREHKLRYTIGATVDLHSEANAPLGAWPRERAVRGLSVHYAVDEEEAGMGGIQYTLRAWTACRGGYVLWRQSKIAQDGLPPTFDLLWTVIEGTEPPR